MSELRELIDALPQPAILVEPDDIISASNEAANQAVGMPLVGKLLVMALRSPRLTEAVAAVRQDGTARSTEFSLIQHGVLHGMEAHCRPLGADNARRLLLLWEDVSEREQANRMRSDFVANVSHELRTPLTAMIGFIETLQGPAKDDANARSQFLEIMAREAERMERLVSDLLSLSRVEAEERRAPSQTVDLAPLAGAVVRMLQPSAEERDVTLATCLPDEPVMVRGDDDQLRQVMSNLIENAIKYGAKGGTVHISVSRKNLRGSGDERVLIEVRDEGDGINPLHLPRLTERFYRVDSHRSRAVGGTGLGLAIVKHIVARHKGRLKIESKQGEGSLFSVILPLAESS